jgi:uncharacterized protein (TIGR02594 family)
VDPVWMGLARAKIGTREIAGALHNLAIIAFHAVTRLRAKTDEIPWCASFVCWCLAKADLPHTRSAAAISYATYGVPCEIKRGAIVVFGKSDPDAKGTGHVGFVDRWNETTVWVLGGNQRNRVSVAPRPRSTIVAIRWPCAA